MRKEFDELLVKTFPNLYKKRYGDMRDTCMCWGFACSEGWFLLLWNLSEKLENIILSLPEDQRQHYCAEQVKEKFGTLRFYFSVMHEEIDKAIDEAENLSYFTCEVCGHNGSLRKNSWWRTLCDTCNEVRDNKVYP